MEPERNIEKELKAYAQQRRTEAGAQPELHPATRKRLQDEAARLAKTAGGKTEAGGRTFWNFWPRLAVAGVAVVAVVAGCWIFLRGSSTSKLEMARNRENFKEELADRSKTENKEKNTANRRLLAAGKNSPAVRNVDSLNLNMAATPAPASPASSAPAVVPPGVPAPTATPFAGTLKDLSGVSVFESTAAPASTDKVYALYPEDVPATPVIQRFRRTSQVASRTADIGGSANVLVNFKVEQTQDSLRMIDSDGSIYNGFVSRTPKAAREPAEAAKQAMAQNGAASAVAKDKKKQPLNLFSFRVSGTNLTLKQEVVFTGDFLTAAEAPAAPASTGELVATNAPLIDGAGAAGGPILPLELQKVRLEGRVLLGKTNKIEIKAAPVKP